MSLMNLLQSEDPAIQNGLLNFGLSLLQSKGNFGNAVGRAGQAGQVGAQNFRQQQALLSRTGLNDKLLQMQIDQQQAQAKQQADLLALQQKYQRSPQQQAMAQNGGPTVAAANAMPNAKGGFDYQGYTNELPGVAGPMAALQMQQLLTKQAPQPIKLGSGDQLLDPLTYKQLANNPKADNQPNAVQEYQFAQGQGYKGTFNDWVKEKARAGASSTTVSYGAPVAGVDAQGNPVFFQPSKNGGDPAIVPGVAPPKKDTPAALQEKLAQNAVTLNKIDQALTLVDQKPGSLGLQNYAGDAVMQRMDPGGVEVRAMIADIGGQKIHDRSGAAVTVGESERLKPYIPAATDNPETVKTKLRLFRKEYAAMQQAIQSGASVTQAAARSGAAPAKSGAVNWSDLK